MTEEETYLFDLSTHQSLKNVFPFFFLFPNYTILSCPCCKREKKPQKKNTIPTFIFSNLFPDLKPIGIRTKKCIIYSKTEREREREIEKSVKLAWHRVIGCFVLTSPHFLSYQLFLRGAHETMCLSLFLFPILDFRTCCSLIH